MEFASAFEGPMLLVASNIHRVFGSAGAQVPALRGVTFAVARNEFMAIMGPSGSGKSTLMNIMGLLDRPSSGRLDIAGHEVTRLSDDELAGLRRQVIGFIFQAYNLLGRTNVLDNVALPLIYAGGSRAQRHDRAKKALDIVGMSHRTTHWPSQLSGGEQQRVAIARALVGEPDLILADEPTGALDSRTGLQIMDLFRTLIDAGRTIVMITHDPDIARHADRILRIKDGAITEDSGAAAAPNIRLLSRSEASS
ncbi:ABC transporter ATP-binding protein [Alsobacter sp. KACC 23698]|uniref:ABC transporter ATP-binding protein n=1 Tax=Alsobacter sp. KACC 23698 TaxID=3149229 RepID=A0AAU7JJV5_9HYPH